MFIPPISMYFNVFHSKNDHTSSWHVWTKIGQTFSTSWCADARVLETNQWFWNRDGSGGMRSRPLVLRSGEGFYALEEDFACHFLPISHRWDPVTVSCYYWLYPGWKLWYPLKTPKICQNEWLPTVSVISVISSVSQMIRPHSLLARASCSLPSSPWSNFQDLCPTFSAQLAHSIILLAFVRDPNILGLYHPQFVG